MSNWLLLLPRLQLNGATSTDRLAPVTKDRAQARSTFDAIAQNISPFDNCKRHPAKTVFNLNSMNDDIKSVVHGISIYGSGPWSGPWVWSMVWSMGLVHGSGPWYKS